MALQHASCREIASHLLCDPCDTGPDVCLEYVIGHAQIERHSFPVWVTVLIVNTGTDQHRVRHHRQSHPRVRGVLRSVMRGCQHISAQRIVEQLDNPVPSGVLGVARDEISKSSWTNAFDLQHDAAVVRVVHVLNVWRE